MWIWNTPYQTNIMSLFTVRFTSTERVRRGKVGTQWWTKKHTTSKRESLLHLILDWRYHLICGLLIWSGDNVLWWRAEPHYGWADVVGDSTQLLSIQPRERPPGVYPNLEFGPSPPPEPDQQQWHSPDRLSLSLFSLAYQIDYFVCHYFFPTLWFVNYGGLIYLNSKPSDLTSFYWNSCS